MKNLIINGIAFWTTWFNLSKKSKIQFPDNDIANAKNFINSHKFLIFEDGSIYVDGEEVFPIPEKIVGKEIKNNIKNNGIYLFNYFNQINNLLNNK